MNNISYELGKWLERIEEKLDALLEIREAEQQQLYADDSRSAAVVQKTEAETDDS